MTTSEEDEDLQQAIRLSMQTVQPTASVGKQEVISLDRDDETTTAGSPSPAPSKKPPSRQSSPPPPAPALGILGLDRTTMEQERLSRLKRKAPISPPPLARKALKTEPHGQKPASTNTEGSFGAPTKAEASSTLPFAHGVIKKTWAFGYPRDGQDIKLEEILQKKDLQLAVLSSFQWDIDWLFAKIHTAQTQLVLVMQADTEEMKAQYRSDAAGIKNLKICFPSMEGQINCMHSKLMLLSYKTHLRIAIPTANLVPYDWGETGTMENTVFVIDLPRLPQTITPTTTPISKEATNSTTEFANDLIYFLHALGLETSIINSFHNFDFTPTRNLGFIHTIGGAHTGPDEPWRRTGYPSLSRAINNLNFSTPTNNALDTTAQNPLEIHYITSSLGALTSQFLTTISLACHGADPLLEYHHRTTKKPPAKNNKSHKTLLAQKETTQQSLTDNFNIYFPSSEAVESSRGGPEGAGTICFSRKWWDAPTFPRHLVKECRARREGLLMHNKLICALPKSPTHPATGKGEEEGVDGVGEQGESGGWVYIGSANLSESAWGKLVTDRGTKRPKLNCRNWECGVVVPVALPRAIRDRKVEGKEEGDGMGGGKGVGGEGEGKGLRFFEEAGVHVPILYPAEKLVGPWFYSE
ncbi:MAG: hypothetical protein LQ350_004340 [Teloschistes chrysophthalmus]|nr:MAG: hypothetical protein LQ350_004340 [Niorma chrysophthalma]